MRRTKIGAAFAEIQSSRGAPCLHTTFLKSSYRPCHERERRKRMRGGYFHRAGHMHSRDMRGVKIGAAFAEIQSSRDETLLAYSFLEIKLPSAP